MSAQKCQAVSRNYQSRWLHSYTCDKQAKVTMVGRPSLSFGEQGEPTEVHLCGTHAYHARKGNRISIATGGRSATGPYARVYLFDPSPLETMRNELAILTSKWGDHSNRPVTQYSQIGRIVFDNADALEPIIAALPQETAQALIAAVEQTDAAIRYDDTKRNRIAELKRLIAETKERGEK